MPKVASEYQLGVSRRLLLGGAVGAGALAALGGPLIFADSAGAAGPTTAASTISLASSLVGKKLSELQAGPMAEPGWHTYSGEWCAVFTSWLLRSVGSGAYLTYASDQYSAYPAASGPQAGDIIYYPDPGHVGIVTGVTGGIPSTIEGNVPDDVWTNTTVKAYPQPWRQGYQFARPNYAPSGIESGGVAVMADTGITLIRSPGGSVYRLLPNGSKKNLGWNEYQGYVAILTAKNDLYPSGLPYLQLTDPQINEIPNY